MSNKHNFYILLFVLILFTSCLHSRNTSQTFAIKARIKINYGNTIVKINGKITENLYHDNIFSSQIRDVEYYNNSPLYAKDTITKNETKYLSAGDEYTFSALPTEVVTINVVSLDGNDVEIIGYEHGKETVYVLKGTNRLGIFIAFQNR